MSRLQELIERMEKLKGEKEASISAHDYQNTEDQDIADYVDDSVGLNRRAILKGDYRITVFLTVDFMTETAAILDQGREVLIPSIGARYPNTKLNTIEKIYIALMDEKYMVRVPEDIAFKARRTLERC